jgi:nucleolar protein 14
MRTKRAEPIKQYNPRFEEDGFVQGRDYDPDRERAEMKKLRKQLKKETKGAARELRKVGEGSADQAIFPSSECLVPQNL